MSVYLVRGATNRIVPGISDIDLRVLGEWTPQQRAWITQKYHALRKWAPVLDPTVPMKLESQAVMRRQYEIDPWDRYGLWEGRHAWKLLWGADIVSELPDLSAPERQSAIYTYLKWWWMVFANTALDADRAAHDVTFTRSICAKAVAEMLRVEFQRQGWNPISRDQALAREAERTAGRSYLRRLNDYVRSGYNEFEGDLVRETAEFLPRCASALCSRLNDDGDSYVAERIAIEIDHPADECFHTEKEAAATERLKEYVEKHWPGSPEVVDAVGIAFVMDDILLVISASTLPDYDRLLAFNRFREAVCRGLRREILCYLRVDDALLQLHAADRSRAWQAILTGAANPETLLALPWPRTRQELGWSQAMEDFLRLEMTLFGEALDSPAVYKANPLDFLRMFWKYLQMIIVARTAAQGAALFPQTVAAVRRGLARIARGRRHSCSSCSAPIALS